LRYLCIAIKRTSSYYYSSSYLNALITVEGSSLNGGAIAGIVIGCIVGIALIILIVVCCLRRRKAA
jgi:hypothetical protein